MSVFPTKFKFLFFYLIRKFKYTSVKGVMLMNNLLINKDDFIKEIMIEDVYILKWKIPNSVLLKKGYMV